MKKRRAIILIIFVVICLGSAISLLLSWKALSVSYYEYYNEKIENAFKIVQLSDLHNSCFGEENSRLIKRIEEEKPDLILMTGDIMNWIIWKIRKMAECWKRNWKMRALSCWKRNI